MTKVIESYGIAKSFGQTKALDNISFSVNESEIFGFIGPDGAGKTTLFRIITTLLIPGEGKMNVLGMDTVRSYKDLRKNIGYMPQYSGLLLKKTMILYPISTPTLSHLRKDSQVSFREE
jgi:ABC-type multidrug transport system ATPase subunit